MTPFRTEREHVAAAIERSGSQPPGVEERARLLRLPVVYDGEDLAELAQRAGLSAHELARRHAAGRYRVAFVGFAPGFAYLSGLPGELASPRRPSPRPRVPAGSVAIGGAWTGIYPSASPGGWNLLGRTSAVLFDAAADPPSLLAPGDRVEFEAVTALPPARPRPPAAAPAGRAAFRVLSPGLFTSIQGAPRRGLGSSGVPPGGAMDPRGLAVANAEVGNPPDAPALEMTLAGPELEALEDAVLSGRGRVRSGERIRFGRVERGAREYVAVAGGFVDPRRAGDPPRRFEAGDVLYTRFAESGGRSGPPSPPTAPPELSDEILLRVVLGPEAAGFAPEQVRRFFASPWRVTPESDRRGLRLEGDPLEHLGAPEIAPSGTVPGTVQVPGSGLPIVLGSGRSGHGGLSAARDGHRSRSVAAGTGPPGSDSAILGSHFSRGRGPDALGTEYDYPPLSIDLNADVGEGMDDAALLPFVTSANVACGLHAGDPSVMDATVTLALSRGVRVGAHPGYADREHFGRVPVHLPAGGVEALVLYQCAALDGFVRSRGGTLTHVKPHGALYHAGAELPDVARAIAEGVRRFREGLVLVGPAGSMLVEAGREADLHVAEEAFADRRYLPDGSTVPRSEPRAVITDPEEAAEQAVGLARDGTVVAIDGTKIEVRADTLCIHGDTPGVVAIAKRIQDRFARDGIRIAPLQSGRVTRREGVVIPPG